MFTQKFQAWVRRWAERAVGTFRDSAITPNMLTLIGLAITTLGAGLVASTRRSTGTRRASSTSASWSISLPII